MNKGLCVSVLILVAAAAFGAQSETKNPGSWSGVILNATCNPDEAFAEA